MYFLNVAYFSLCPLDGGHIPVVVTGGKYIDTDCNLKSTNELSFDYLFVFLCSISMV